MGIIIIMMQGRKGDNNQVKKLNNIIMNFPSKKIYKS